MEVNYLLIPALTSVVSILFAGWIFSLFFRVNKTLKMQKTQIELLIKIAQKQGIPWEEVKPMFNAATEA